MAATIAEIARDPRIVRDLIRPSDYWPWDWWARHDSRGPTPKQLAFLMLNPIGEGLFGGQVGGGKSDALLLAALQYVDLPDYDAIIFRRTFPELNAAGGLIDRSQDWLGGTDAVYNIGEHRWLFPTGATLTFGHMQYENDKYNYQSAEFAYAGFDELTLFNESQFSYISGSRMRKRKTAPFPLRVRGATNPVGPGRDWVRTYFGIVRDPKTKLFRGTHPRRFFIPSGLDDNPHLDKVDYERRLAGLSSIEYRQLRHGDWDVEPEGTKFKRWWFKIWDPSTLPRSGLRFVRYWDPAGTDDPKKVPGRPKPPSSDPDWTVGLLMAKHEASGTYFVIDVVRFRASQGEAEDRMAATARADRTAYGSIPTREEQEPGSSGKKVIAFHRKGIFDGYDYQGVVSSGSKEIRANPAAARSEHGEIVLLSGKWNEKWLDEICAFPQGLHDDQVDATSGAYNFLSGSSPMVAPGGAKQTSGWRMEPSR